MASQRALDAFEIVMAPADPALPAAPVQTPSGQKRPRGPAPGPDPGAAEDAPAAKRARVDDEKKKKKKRAVQDPTSVFLAHPALAQNGVLTFDKAPVRAADPVHVVPPREEHTALSLVPSREGVLWLDAARAPAGPSGTETRPLVDLLATPMGASVPLAEKLLMTVTGLNENLKTMYKIRVHLGLPTGLEKASATVRLASGLSAAPVPEETREAEEKGRLPPLVGVPAATLAKTRQTWRGAGQITTTHGFAHDTARRATFTVTPHFEADREAHWRAFFARDAHDPASGFARARPEDHPLYHQLRREQGEHFARRDEYLDTAATSVPRTDIVYVDRRHIDKFRMPPRGGPGRTQQREDGRAERACVHGVLCHTLRLMRERHARDEDVYVGREFLLPDEDRAFEDTGALPAVHGECVNCELRAYCESVYSRDANQRAPAHPRQRFRVKCEEGQYCVADMLVNVVHGNVPSGITGFVPRYDPDYLQLKPLAHPEDATRTLVVALADVSPVFHKASARPLAF
jgi:hypothetical protein